MAAKRRKKRPSPDGGGPSASKRRASSTREAPSDEEPDSTPAPRPWWLLGVILVIVGVVAYVGRTNGASTEATDTTEVEIPAPPQRVEELRVEVIRRYAHDTDSFTQGLLWHEGMLYESTGRYGHSELLRVALETGASDRERSVDRRLFAEGLARVGDRLYQLTWRAGQAHVWTLDAFEHRRTFEYDGEGWGLCHDGEHLVMSDGSDRLAFRDPENFQVDHVVRVRDADGPVADLNELECVDGAIWANVWQTDRIVRIDPRTGRVTASVDASGLLDATERWEADVLNGIAWIPEREHFLITGKLWPWLYEVELVPAED